MLVTGLVCVHCFSQGCRKSFGKNNESPLNFTNEPREDLELNESISNEGGHNNIMSVWTAA